MTLNLPVLQLTEPKMLQDPIIHKNLKTGVHKKYKIFSEIR